MLHKHLHQYDRKAGVFSGDCESILSHIGMLLSSFAEPIRCSYEPQVEEAN